MSDQVQLMRRWLADWPNALEARDDLSTAAKHVGAYLGRLADNHSGECFALRSTIAKALSMGERSVSRAVTELRAHGLVSTRTDEGRRCLTFTLHHPGQHGAAQGQAGSGPSQAGADPSHIGPAAGPERLGTSANMAPQPSQNGPQNYAENYAENSTAPNPADAGSNDLDPLEILPSRPPGRRDRDRARYDEALTHFVDRHFPELAGQRQESMVVDAANKLPPGTPPTAAHLRTALEHLNYLDAPVSTDRLEVAA